MSEIKKNEDSVYDFNEEGINLYYETAYGKFIKSRNITPQNTETIPDFEDFFTAGNTGMEKDFISKNKDYHKILHEIDKNVGYTDKEEIKNKLWITRLKHVCGALIETLNTMGNTKDTNQNAIFKLGIFGSESVTSDIDIGVCYSRDYQVKAESPKISEVVKTFEDCFSGSVDKINNNKTVGFGYTSLDLDVEMYGDYLKKNEQPYLEATDYAYKVSLPFIVAGMLKNQVQAYYDKDHGDCDVRRGIKDNLGSCDVNVIQTAKNFIQKTFETEEAFGEILPETLDGKEQVKIIKFYNDVKESISEDVLSHASDTLKMYMTKTYDEGRAAYYTHLNTIHTKYIENPVVNDTLYPLICEALVYRAESYIAPSTVYHVVYQIQKQDDSVPLKKADYKISILEQLSYFFRFFTHHGKQPVDTDATITQEEYEHLDKKNGKYMSRLLHGLCEYNYVAASEQANDPAVEKNEVEEQCVKLKNEAKTIKSFDASSGSSKNKKGGSRRRSAKNPRPKSRNKTKVRPQYKSRHNKKSAARKSKPRRR